MPSASNNNLVCCRYRITVTLALSLFSEWSELNSKSSSFRRKPQFYFIIYIYEVSKLSKHFQGTQPILTTAETEAYKF